MSESAADQNLEATPRQRDEARREGRVPRSPALSSSIIVVGGLAVLATFGGPAIETISQLLRRHLGDPAQLSIDAGTAAADWQQALLQTLSALLPLLGGFLAVAVLANFVQTGVLFLPSNVLPNLSRINPSTGVRRIFASSNYVSVVLGLLQMAVAGVVVWWCVRTELHLILSLPAMNAEGIARSAGRILFSSAVKVGLGLFAMALLDYAYRRWSHERELRMTQEQQREELRMIEGDPQVSSRRRQMHAGMRRAAGDPNGG